MEKEKIIILLNVVILITLVTLSTIAVIRINGQHMTMDGMRKDFIAQKNAITGEMLTKGMYRCCLEKPCTYCIEKTPGHGEGAECSCLEDIVNGVHPCGVCIGEIL